MAVIRRTPLVQRLYALVESSGMLDQELMHRAFVRAYFLYKRHVEDPFVGLTANHPELFRGGHVLDVGANIGYTATVFRQALSPGFRVFAFEAEERNVATLRRTVARYQAVEDIVVVHAAVGARDGTADLWHNRTNAGDHRVVTPTFAPDIQAHDRVTRVPMVSIDTFLGAQPPAPIAFIKIDVQGYELPVCQGMTATLEQHPKAHVALEYAPGGMRLLGFDAQQVEQFFRDRHYTLSMIATDGTLQPYDRRRIDTLDRDAYVDILCSRDAV